MDKSPIDSGNGDRLASLIAHRLGGKQRLYLVSIGPQKSTHTAERDRTRDELLALLDEMRRNVSASGVSEDELTSAIDEAIADVRARDD